MSKPPSWPTCYHEAGHAAIGTVLKRGVLSVCAWSRLHKSPSGSMLLGWTYYYHRPRMDRRSQRFREWCRRELLATMAGHYAALRGCPHSKGGGSAEDWFEAFGMFHWLHRKTPWRRQRVNRAYRAIRMECRRLVRDRWAAIEAVARRLRWQHRLSGAQVREIVRLTERSKT